LVLQSHVCALLAAKNQVDVFLHDGVIVPDLEGIITGGHDNTIARMASIREGEQLNARALQAMSDRSSPTTARAIGASSRERVACPDAR
jgi:hypothetical protein